MPGIGKTTLAAYAPDVVFMNDNQEDGITTLKQQGLVPAVPQFPACHSLADILSQLDWLATAEHNHKTLVFDTVGGLERLIHDEVCRREYNGEWGDKGFNSYKAGYEVSLTDVRVVINAFNKIRDDRGMRVILLGHARVSPFKNPEGPDYDRYTPDCHPKTWSLLHKWADMVLFMNYVTVVQQAKSDPLKKGKAIGGHQRMMYTEHHASYDAKNRHNLVGEIDMGESGADAWANLVEAIKAGKAVNNG